MTLTAHLNCQIAGPDEARNQRAEAEEHQRQEPKDKNPKRESKRRTDVMYLRFVIDQISEYSSRRSGILQAAYDLLEQPGLKDALREELNQIMTWFDTNLPVPTQFTRRSSQNVPGATNQALSWFKDSAKSHIAKARELSILLGNEGYLIEMLCECRVGYITYEDRYQIVAIPFKETRT